MTLYNKIPVIEYLFRVHTTSRYFLFGFLTLFDLLSVLFSRTIDLGQGALGSETFVMALLLLPFPVGFLGSLNFSFWITSLIFLSYFQLWHITWTLNTIDY